MSSHAAQGKKSLEKLAIVHAHPQNYAFVSNNVAFYFVSTAKPPNADTMVSFGCSDTMFSSTVLTEAGELQIPLLQVSSLFMRFPSVTVKFVLHCLWQ